MKKYENLILEKLLSKYEKSKLSKEGSKRKLSIFLNFDDKNMPDYVCECSYLYENEIENAVKNLENERLINVGYYSDGKIKKVNLLLDNTDKCYNKIGRKTPRENRDDITLLLNKYENKGELVDWFVKKINKLISSYQSYLHYFRSLKELEELLIVLSRLEEQKEEISMRSFSAKFLKDSKRLEVILYKVESILRDFFETDEEDILVRYNIYKNPTFVYIKGIGKFRINNQIIDLEDIQSELILSSHHIECLEVLSLNCKEIVTVENLTTFYEYPLKDRCVIYLGGFHNETRKKLLSKLYKFNNSISFIHSGDIDAGGFYILNHLIEDTGIDFKARDMDIKILNKYSEYTLELTEEDKKRIKKLLNVENLKDYYEVFNYMLAKNVKIEQENIYYE